MYKRLKTQPVVVVVFNRGFWFRIYDYGLFFKLVERNWVPLFSERYGFKKAYYLGRLRMEFLKPDRR